MKKLISLIALLVIFASTTSAQPKKDQLEHFSAGFNLTQYQSQFGYGVNVTTPYKHYFAMRLTANLQYLNYVPTSTINEVWSPYGTVRLGFVTRGFVIFPKVSIYSEGGLAGVIPNGDFSSKGFVLGGYGLFGFEFHPRTSMGQFIEIGGVGTGATADRVDTRPSYNNGLIVSAGTRIYF